MAHSYGADADVSILLWEQLSAQVIAIVGVGGFNSLYARSLCLSQPSFPWLAGCPPVPPGGQAFSGLRLCFEHQSPDQISAANTLLLISFTDVLASVIGDQLTRRILHSAWSDVAPGGQEK
ncbi:MAG: hypothetical protein U1C96_13565 [Gallionella sp.]|nr:hypothetical protein [Gallionella sp.]